MGFLVAEQEIDESTNPSFLQQCKICNLSLIASSHGLMGIVSMPCVQFWQFEGIYITYRNSHTGCHKMCLSNCNLHFAECHFAQLPTVCECSLCGMAGWRVTAQIALSGISIALLSCFTGGGGQPLSTAEHDDGDSF